MAELVVRGGEERGNGAMQEQKQAEAPPSLEGEEVVGEGARGRPDREVSCRLEQTSRIAGLGEFPERFPIDGAPVPPDPPVPADLGQWRQVAARDVLGSGVHAHLTNNRGLQDSAILNVKGASGCCQEQEFPLTRTIVAYGGPDP